MIHTVCARARFCCIEHVVVDCAEPVTNWCQKWDTDGSDGFTAPRNNQGRFLTCVDTV